MEIFGHNTISIKILNFSQVFALGSRILRITKKLVWMYREEFQQL